MSIDQRKPIYLGNAYLVRQEFRYYSAATDTFEVWTGQTATVSITTDAAGTLPVSGLSALPMTASSINAGVYYAVVSAALVAGLAPYAGQTVYQVTVAGANNELRVVVPLLVSSPRYV